jgi:hypothetical protein
MINAFHPDYAKLYLQDFLKELRELSYKKRASQTLTGYVKRRRKVDPSHGTLHGISKKLAGEV